MSNFICKIVMVFLLAGMAAAEPPSEHAPLVLMSDFGTTERFVASMKGVAMIVDAELQIHDLTHQIEPFNIWQASYLLSGTIDFWPVGTVFVSVVDPGVGTKRRSVVVETRSGHYIVTPDNGSLTLVADKQGIKSIREIDERTNRRPGSADSHTFHGRDVYSYTGARLAASVISYAEVGPELPNKVVRLTYQKAAISDNKSIIGNLTHVEMPFGNIVTNIPKGMLDKHGITPGQNSRVKIKISKAGRSVFTQSLNYAPSFGFVGAGEPLLYSDSLQMLGLAINSGDFSAQHSVGAGHDWTIEIAKQTAD